LIELTLLDNYGIKRIEGDMVVDISKSYTSKRYTMIHTLCNWTCKGQWFPWLFWNGEKSISPRRIEEYQRQYEFLRDVPLYSKYK